MLCHQRESTPTGEHVWPSWLLRKLFPPNDGPYSVERKGPGEIPDVVWQGSSFNRVKLPCCAACNGRLNTRFEAACRGVVERLVGQHDDPVLDTDDTGRLGLWLVKTTLLLSHPAAVNSSGTIPAERWDADRLPQNDLYAWLTNDGPPPDGLSAWLSRVDADAVARQHQPLMSLPTVVADGQNTHFLVRSQGFLTWEITLLYHPGWPVTHPLEPAGQSARVWPPRTEPLDLDALPAIDRYAVAWAHGPELWFAEGTYRPDTLPPLTDVGTGHQIPGVIFARP
ncbi:hypothetical protein CLV68_5972 [Actinokineospora cianjurensis]|uniref:Uncharacterized protein n=1 Tax=Actinokineospora cianjurensis TaxID=585224 RepID=A0A421AX54_9PSEU|nr:hypothetical protein CLV68_5972 [Actinokineospora cianjurensis]